MIASSTKAKIIDITSILLSVGFIAICLAALAWRQPKFFSFLQDNLNLFFLKRFYPG